MIPKSTAACVAIAIVFITAGRVEAQQQGTPRVRPNVTFEELPSHIRAGQTIYVTDPQGREIKGQLVRLSAASMTLRGEHGEREFARAEIHQVARHGDSVANGTAIGMGVLGGWGLVGALRTDDGVSCADVFGLGGCAALVGMTAAMGAGIGALIDYSIKGRTTVYQSAPQRISVSPFMHPRGGGVRLMVRF